MARALWRWAVAGGISVAIGAAPAVAQDGEDKPLPVRLDAAVVVPSLGQFWGAVLVAKDGAPVLAKGYGIAGPDGTPIDRTTLFDIGSITKQFTAAAVMKLKAQGKLSLDEPVAAYLPELEGRALERARRVTLRHLMTHTSGMNDEGAIQAINFPDRDKAVSIALGSRPSAAPGAAFDYCNAGYIVAAAIVEHVSGVPYERFVVDEVLRPAGMKTAGFINGVGIDPGTPTAARVVEPPPGYPGGATTGKLVNDRREQLGWGLKGAGGIAASLDDMLAWSMAMIDDKVIDAGAHAEMFKPGKENYGLGWFITLSPGATEEWSHSGGTRGFTAFIAVYPRERAAIAVFTNARNNPVAVHKGLEAEFFGVGTPGPIEATIMLGALALDNAVFAEWKGQTSFHVTRAGDGPGERVTLEVVRDGVGPAARVAMSTASAKALAADIRSVCGAGAAQEPDRPGTFMLAGGVYRDRWPGARPPAEFRLDDGVQWQVMPAYHGTGQDGKSIVDARPTLVLVDEENSFWPLIMTISPGEALGLAEHLNPTQP
jgi:CubicO group peptidase (beta-lactamase class C family)